MQEFNFIEWLAAGVATLGAFVVKGLHSRQNRLEERLDDISRETQMIVGRETHELRRVIDSNHTQIINMLENRAQMMMRRRGDVE